MLARERSLLGAQRRRHHPPSLMAGAESAGSFGRRAPDSVGPNVAHRFLDYKYSGRPALVNGRDQRSQVYLVIVAPAIAPSLDDT
jgi:hypothetical protein